MKRDQKNYCSVTMKTHDEAVLHCLRALSHYTQQTGRKMESWGGTGRGYWIRDGHCVTFSFSNMEYRSKFIEEVLRLLPNSLWEKID